MFSILSRYSIRIFSLYLCILVISFVAIMCLMELVMSPESFSWIILGCKIPLLLHKVFPFVVFLSTLLFLWRLIRYQEMDALQSSGVSPWRLMLIMALCVSTLEVVDLFVWVPIGQKLLNPFKEKQGKISIDVNEWSMHSDAKRYILVRQGHPFHVLQFAPYSVLTHHYAANAGMLIDNKRWFLSRAWTLSPGKAPKVLSKLEVICPSSDHFREHPGLMSLLDIGHSWGKNQEKRKVLLMRRDQLLSHSVWVVSLVALAFALMLGTYGFFQRFLSVASGLLLCFVLYISKEWLHALSLPYAFAWSPWLTWSAPLLTFFISLLILWEKREF